MILENMWEEVLENKYEVMPQIISYWISEEYGKKSKDGGNELYKLGEVLVIKNELSDVFDGEVIVLCPGYGKEDIKLVEDKNKGIVYVIFNPINGEKSGHKYKFEADSDYDYKVTYNIKNGVFKLKAKYDIQTNVKIDENL